MPKTRTRITMDEAVAQAVRNRAALSGKSVSQVVEEALRRHLGFDLIDSLWERGDLSESEGMKLALEAQRSSRHAPRE